MAYHDFGSLVIVANTALLMSTVPCCEVSVFADEEFKKISMNFETKDHKF